MQTTTIARIRPARWFRHALSASDLAAMLEARHAAMGSARDGRALFCHLRARQAAVVRDLIAHGAFDRASAWIERLEIERTYGYLRALEGWDRADLALTAMPWRAVFALHRQRQIEPALGLALGSLVHEAYDLPLALARAGDASGGVDTLAAFATLGEIHASAIDRFRSDVLGARMSGGRHLGHPSITAAMVRERWSHAWLDAQELTNIDDEARRHAIFTRMEAAVLSDIRALAGRGG